MPKKSGTSTPRTVVTVQVVGSARVRTCCSSVLQVKTKSVCMDFVPKIDNMWQEEECQSHDNGSATPPLPSRAPPPLIPPSFVRSQSLGKTMVTEESLALTLLGRHTHFYDYNPTKNLDQLEFTKVSN